MTNRAPILVLVLLVACQGTASRRDRSVEYLVAHGRFEEALARAHAAWEEDPGAPGAEQDYQLASVAYLLQRGREATFEGEDVAALEYFQRALEIDPDAVQAREWLVKTRRKLSWRWFLRARRAHASARLLDAAHAYQTAIEYDRDNLDAVAGLHGVGLQLDYREGLSQDYYNEGLRALRDQNLHVAGSRFDYAGKYRLKDDRPARRRQEVDRALSEHFTTRALELETEGYFAAAKNEFRSALRYDEENRAALEGLERMRVESEAHELLKSGDMWIHRGELDKAVVVLEEGKEKSRVQDERFDELIARIDEVRAEELYQRGLNYEHDFRYARSAEVYRRLLEERGYYQDARARLDRLEQVIAEVQALYAGLEEIEDPAVLEERLQRIDVLWPEYQDVQERLDALGAPED